MHRRSLIKRATEQFNEHEAIAAGREAETLVGDFLAAKLRGKLDKAMVWHDIRVPRSDSSGKYEIDYLILTPYGALFLEVKNFGGRLDIDPSTGRWMQTTRSGQKKSHECPISLTQKKMSAVGDFLKRNGLDIDTRHFHLRIVMTNANSGLSSAMTKDPRICTVAQLEESFGLLLPSKPGFFGIGKSPSAFPRAKEMEKQLSRLPSWDEIELHGGKILRGDIQKDFRTQRPDRLETDQVHFVIPRHRFWGWFHPAVYFYEREASPYLPWRLTLMRPADQIVKIQLAGDHIVTEVKQYNIKRLRYGWTDESYYQKF